MGLDERNGCPELERLTEAWKSLECGLAGLAELIDSARERPACVTALIRADARERIRVRANATLRQYHEILPEWARMHLAPGTGLARWLIRLQLSRAAATSAATQGTIALWSVGAEYTADVESVLDSLWSEGEPKSAALQSVVSWPASTGDSCPLVDRFGLLRPLGRGGFGEVWLAWDTDYKRPVAVKLLFPELLPAGSALSERLMNEARASSELHHKSVVKVYEARVSRPPNPGLPIIVMSLCADSPRSAGGAPRRAWEVDTESIARPLDARPGEWYSAAESASIVIELAKAVAAGHNVGRFHCDLSPRNVLIAPLSRDVYLTDFGLSRSLHLEARPSVGAAASHYGTPGFMPPEQARGESPSVRSDVFGLGAVLYYLLTEGPPYSSDEQHIRCRPASLVELAKKREPDLTFPPGCPRPLRHICEKALAFDPTIRYRSSLELASDLEAWRANRVPPTIGASGRLEPLHLWYRRHRTLVRLSAVAALVIVALSTYYAINLVRANRSLTIAVKDRTTALALSESQRIGAEARAALGETPQRGVALAAYGLSRADASNTAAMQESEQALLEVLRATAGQGLATGFHERVFAVAIHPRGDTVYAGDSHGNVVEWVVAYGKEPRRRRAIGRLPTVHGDLPDSVYHLVNDPDGHYLALGARAGGVFVVDLTKPETEQRLVQLQPPGQVDSLFFSDHGNVLYAAGMNGVVRWKTPLMDTAVPELLLVNPDNLHSAWQSPAESWILTSCDKSFKGGGQVLELWRNDPERPKRVKDTPIARLADHVAVSVAFSPDDKWLVVCAEDKTARIWRLDGEAPTEERWPAESPGLLAGVSEVAFNPDNRSFLAADRSEQRVWRWDWSVQGPGQCHPFPTDASIIARLRATPDGQHFVTTGWDRMVQIDNTRLRGHDDTVGPIAFNTVHPWFATGSADGSVRLWPLPGHDDPLDLVTDFFPDPGSQDRVVRVREWVFRPGGDSHLECLHTRSGTQERRWTLVGAPGRMQGVAVASSSTDGHVAAVMDKAIMVWKVSDSDTCQPTIFCAETSFSDVAFGGGDRWLLAWSRFQPALNLLAMGPDDAKVRLELRDEAFEAAAVDAAGTRLFAVSRKGHFRSWLLTPPDGPRLEHDLQVGFAQSLAASPDGKRVLVVGSGRKGVVLGGFGAPELISVPIGRVMEHGFTQDSRHLVFMDYQSLSTLDLERMATPVELYRGSVVIDSLSVAAESSKVAIGARDGVVRIFSHEGASWRSLSSKLFQVNGIVKAAFCHSDTCLVVNNAKGQLLLWRYFEANGDPVLVAETMPEERSFSLWPPGRAPFVLPDGAMLTDWGPGIRLWPAGALKNNLLTLARLRAGRNLSTAEWQKTFSSEPYAPVFGDFAHEEALRAPGGGTKAP